MKLPRQLLRLSRLQEILLNQEVQAQLFLLLKILLQVIIQLRFIVQLQEEILQGKQIRLLIPH